MSDCKFVVGDRVSDMGRKGTVLSVDDGGLYTVKVNFDDGGTSFFSIDGKSHLYHTRPSLKKLKKKKARYFPGVWQRIEMKNGAFLMAFVPVVPYAELIEFDGMSVWIKNCGAEKPKGA